MSLSDTENKIFAAIQMAFSAGFTIFVHNPNSRNAALLNAGDNLFVQTVQLMNQPNSTTKDQPK